MEPAVLRDRPLTAQWLFPLRGALKCMLTKGLIISLFACANFTFPARAFSCPQPVHFLLPDLGLSKHVFFTVLRAHRNGVRSNAFRVVQRKSNVAPILKPKTIIFHGTRLRKLPPSVSVEDQPGNLKSSVGSNALTLSGSAFSSQNTGSLAGNGVVSAVGTPLCGIPDDVRPHLPTDSQGHVNWDSFVAPAKGKSYVDPVFGCTVTRLTDDSLSYHDYSTTQAMSASDAYILIGHDGQMRIVNLKGDVIVDQTHMPAHNSGHYLWDATDGNKFYYAFNNSLMSGTITGHNSVKRATVREFNEYQKWIAIMDYSNMSADRDHIALVGENRAAGGIATIDFFVYQFSTKQKIYVFKSSTQGCVVNGAPAPLGGQPGGDCMHKLLLTADNQPVMEWHMNRDPKMPAGCVSAFAVGAGCKTITNADGTLRILQSGTTHMDTGWDNTGTKSIIVENFDPDPNATHRYDPCYNHGGIAIKDVNTFALSCLLSTDFRSGHVSYLGGPHQPWVGIDVEDDRDPGPERYNTHPGHYAAPTQPCLQLEDAKIDARCWTVYENEIMIIRIDGAGNFHGLGGTAGKTYRLAHSRSRQAEHYYAQPRASISRDGKYIVFDSNMAHPDGNCTGKEANGCADVYVVGPLFR